MKTVQGLRDLFAAVLPRHQRVSLCYSGGKESALLAHALRPWQSQVELVHVNTGANFPHVDEFIRRAADGFKLVELRSDQPSHIAAFGLPSRIIPIRNTVQANAFARSVNANALEPKAKAEIAAIMNAPVVQNSFSCCGALRGQPMTSYFLEERIGLIVHGQREADGAPLVFSYRSELVMPLWDWSESDVLGQIREHGVELPAHYSEVTDSLDCWSCTAGVTPARMKWMQRHYPDRAAQVREAMMAVHVASSAILSDLEAAITATTCSAPETELCT